MNRHPSIPAILATLLLTTSGFIPGPANGASALSENDRAVAESITRALQGLPGDYAVDADHGTATLIGTMPDQHSVNLAIARARIVPGVTAVKNELRVDPALRGLSAYQTVASPSDAVITDAEVAANLRQHLRPFRGVSVGVSNGTAILSGTVPAYDDKERVGRIASRVAGVHAVKNDLTVEIGTEE